MFLWKVLLLLFQLVMILNCIMIESQLVIRAIVVSKLDPLLKVRMA